MPLLGSARLAAFLVVLALPGTSPAAVPKNATPADRASIDDASAYLQSLEHVKGRFFQTSPRGAHSSGDLYVERPGKARFAYDPPSGMLVVADGKTISVWDPRLSTFDKAPLGSTPLSLLLVRQVRLDKDVDITRIDHYADYFALTLRDASRRAEGRIVLYFNASPVSLRGWTVIDAQGLSTQIQVSGLRNAEIDPGLFVLNDPRKSPKP
jgi:outer membrane lipoprotein-sorting protein